MGGESGPTGFGFGLGFFFRGLTVVGRLTVFGDGF